MYEKNPAYILKNETNFLSTDYKISQNQSDDLFVKCEKVIFNGNIQLFYFIENKVSLCESIEKFSVGEIISVVSSLISQIKKVKENGFLSCQNIDISPNRLFIEPSTKSIKLLYLPLKDRLFNSSNEFEDELRAMLLEIFENTAIQNEPQIHHLIANLKNYSCSINDILNNIIAESPIKNTLKNRIEPAQKITPKLQLVALNTPVNFSITVNKPEFIIGRKQEVVDGYISFNRMIGRIHCKIITQDNQFAVIDLESANGTYLNNIRLQANKISSLKDGDILKLANSEFKVSIG